MMDLWYDFFVVVFTILWLGFIVWLVYEYLMALKRFILGLKRWAEKSEEVKQKKLDEVVK